MNRPSTSTKVDFHALMKDLLHFMQIPLPATLPAEVYSFSFDGKTDIHLHSAHPGSMDLLMEIGTLKNTRPDTVLQNLLGMNRYVPGGFPLNIGMDPGSGKVTLWSRHTLDGLDLDKLNALLNAVLDCAAMAQDHLNGRSLAKTASSGSRHPALAASSSTHAGIQQKQPI